MTDYNWQTIKHQYIHGIKQEDGTKTYPSYADLSKLHGPGKSTISRHSNSDPDGTWEEQQERYRNKVEQKVIEQKSQIEAENIVEDDLLCESFARKALKIAEKKLDKLNDLLDVDKWVSGIDILNTINAGGKAQEMIKVAQGEIIERKKLEIDGKLKANPFDDINGLEETLSNSDGDEG